MASPSKDATLMWDIMSQEEDMAMMEKFSAESNKVVKRWFLGDATYSEKDAAVAFLTQLGAVQINIHSGNQQRTSQKQVSILFGDGENSGDTKDAILREGNQVKPAPDSSDQDAEKNREAQVNEDDDDDEDNNYSVWMSGPDDEDEDDDNQIRDPAPVVEESSTTQPREEHPCPDCNTVLHSLWELDLHKLSSCTGKAPQKNANRYNCDQCSKSFVHMIYAANHLCKVHNMSRTEANKKLGDLKSTERQDGRKTNKRVEWRSSSDSKNSNELLLRKSKRLCVKLQPLAIGCLEALENETVDRRMFASDNLNKGSDRSAPVSNDKRDLFNTSDDHQNLTIKTEKESSSPMSDCEPVHEAIEVSESVQCAMKKKSLSTMAALESIHGCPSEQVEEKQKDNSITVREVGPLTTDRRNTAGTTIPLPQLQSSGAEVMEKNDEDLYQECSDEEVRVGGENKNESTSPHMESVPEVNEIHEPSQEKNFDVLTEKRAKEVDGEGDYDNENSFTYQKPAKGKIPPCNLCNLQFKTSYKRRKHMLETHTEEEYMCSTCNRSFVHKNMFQMHLRTHMDINDREKFHCKICKKIFLVKNYYQKHMKSHVEKPEPFKCDTCGKLLTTKSNLDRHINRKHTKETKFTCEVCGKIFYTRGSIKQHLLTHTGQKNWKCDECGFASFHKYQIESHKKVVHPTGGKCLCEICGAAYKNKNSLKQHHLTAHTNDYNFSCDVCGKKFKRSSLLSAHVKIHSNDPKDKPFECELCGKYFRNKCKLKVHMDWHNNVRSHTCKDCGKSFLTKGNLDKHRFVHTGKKPYECRICSKGLTDFSALRKHLDGKHQITLKKKVTEGACDENIEGSAAIKEAVLAMMDDAASN